MVPYSIFHAAVQLASRARKSYLFTHLWSWGMGVSPPPQIRQLLWSEFPWLLLLPHYQTKSAETIVQMGSGIA